MDDWKTTLRLGAYFQVRTVTVVSGSVPEKFMASRIAYFHQLTLLENGKTSLDRGFGVQVFKNPIRASEALKLSPNLMGYG